jgi:Family of unknown function (DUF6152)
MIYRGIAYGKFDMRKALRAMTLTPAAIAAGLVAVPSPAMAHHSFALFDVSKTVALEGTVKKFDWTNPHSWITLEVLEPDRTVSEWLIELPSAATLARDRWNKNFVRPGEKLIVRVNPLKDGRKGGALASFRAEDQPPDGP